MSIIYPGSVGRELTALVIPALMAQALDPFAQLMETAYIGRLGTYFCGCISFSVSLFSTLFGYIKCFTSVIFSYLMSYICSSVCSVVTFKWH